MNGNDEQLIWETYQQLYEAISSSEALSRMRGAIAAGQEDLIPDILDLVDVKDRPALAKKAKMFGISHPAFNAVIPPAGEGEEYPGTGDVEWFETDDQPEDEIPGSVDPEVVVDNLRQAIENLEPAGDVKGYYWDAIELNVDQQRLDDMLDEYVESDHLSPEEREYIKQEDEPPPGPEEWAHMS